MSSFACLVPVIFLFILTNSRVKKKICMPFMLLFYNSHKKFFTSIKLALISKACYSFISFQDSKTRSASVVHASESRASAMLLSIVLRIVCHSARRLVGQEPEPSQATGLWHAASLGVSCHYFPRLWTFQLSPPGTSTSARREKS